MDETRINLPLKDMPDKWYNVAPDLPRPLDPPLNPETKEPIGPEALAPIFPMELIKQEVSQENWIEIPDEVQRMLGLWRPTPLHRAFSLEKELKTPARIYYKNESVSPPGSHKPNTAVAQAYYNKAEGVRRICTETGAGQWGSALSFACKLLGLEATVYMVKCSYYQKPFRKSLMHIWGATVYPSPTDLTQCGRAVLEMDPESPGSLGCAISEAVEDAATHDDAKYSLGSVLNHVLLHQTVVGLEIKEQLKMAGDKANVVVGCVGGGSNFAGAMLPFVPDKLKGEDIEFLAVEPCSCPTLTKGPYRYDFGDLAKMTPLMKMYTLGHGFIPPAIHAGGLRYHGDAPILCLLVNEGVVTPRAYHQSEVFEASMLFAATEGLVCAPETSHAVKGAIDEALKCKETGEEKCIVLNYSGHGHFDLAAYDAWLAGELEDYDYPMDKIEEALKDVPVV